MSDFTAKCIKFISRWGSTPGELTSLPQTP